jgi:26S proteasome regulatory subunit N6
MSHTSALEAMYNSGKEHFTHKRYAEFETNLVNAIKAEVPANEENLKVKESALLDLSDHFAKTKNPEKLQQLMEVFLGLINQFPNAKAGKIIRIMMDQGAKIEGNVEWQVDWCKKLIKWCQEEKRTFLRQRVEIRLATVLWNLEKHQQALDVLEPLLKEIRKIDDKHLLVEIELLEAKVYHSLEFFAKSKSSLTAARACANSIYCPPLVQADLDQMSGILQAEDKDYKTGYSYFYESFEAFNSFDDPRAIYALKYMILCKIMMNHTEEVNSILHGKFGLKYAGAELDAMKAVTLAHSNRSLKEFKSVLSQYTKQIEEDSILKHHIKSLYENLLEQNLYRIVEPYSKVQISHIAKNIGMNDFEVQTKLSEMILDKKFDGTLDQGNGALIIFDEDKVDKLYENSLDTMKNLDLVIDKLFDKAKLLKA